MTCWKKKL